MKTIAILALASSTAAFAAGDTAASVQGFAPTPSIRTGGTEILEVLGRFPELVKEFDVKSKDTQGDKDVNTDTQGDKDVSTDTQSGTKILESIPTEMESAKADRGSNFTTDEDCQLARSWINISQDASKGSGQKSDQFWSRIETNFNQYSDGAIQRSGRSLSSRWATILDQCNVGCFATVRSKLTSGESDGPEDAELVRRAKELFANKADARGKQSRFLFLHAWEILRTVPKWQDFRSQQPGNDRAKKRMKLDENDDIVSDDDVRQRSLFDSFSDHKWAIKSSRSLKYAVWF
ncbi:hypothetical protein H257_18467 [Aphanomyces astaci]|uniref:No apical meristem-associated C-terminal domain-containing protein n=1 Tax=Aphanomyces astaci TaxID=112090 RepID=W4FCR9_APHAT|nr:hypothetical protein H257_18467 [Aphanomyces astaci]ETV64689.1 hypothetical protein H257_18467 [Aphanomyces astaci]|eukprot:XP_009845824.1 hypothetical protein H257_18467 [Aphanomyces astaci]